MNEQKSEQIIEKKKMIASGYGVPRKFPEKILPPKPDNLPEEIERWLNSIIHQDKLEQ